MSRIGAFFLGVLVGVIFVLGAFAGGIYYAATGITPNQVTGGSAKNYIGTFGDQSIYEIVSTLQNLYTSKIGITDEDGNYYTLGQFCEDYEIDLATSLGVELPDEILALPLLELFNSNTQASDALAQVKVSAIPAIVNLFASEDGTISSEVIAELSNYSITELFNEDGTGLQTVFQNIKFADLLPDSFPQYGTGNDLMYAVGQTYIGKILGAMKSSDSIYMQLKGGDTEDTADDGAMVELGKLTVVDLLNTTDETLISILGDTKVYELVDENGGISTSALTDDLYVGSLLGNSRTEIDEENVDEYTESEIDASVKYRVTDSGLEYIKQDSDGTWYKALSCSDDTHTEDDHTTACFAFEWLDKAGNQVDALFAALGDFTISALLSSDDASAEILSKFQNMKIGKLLDALDVTYTDTALEALTDMTIAELTDPDGGINNIYIGSLLQYSRTEVTNTTDYTTFNELDAIMYNTDGATNKVNYIKQSVDGTWYEATLVCEEDNHTHDASCFEVWSKDGVMITGIYRILANFTIGELTNSDEDLVEKFYDVKISDIMGSNSQSNILTIVQDFTIGDLVNGEFDNLYVGTLLQYERKLVDLDGNYTVLVETEETKVYTDSENTIYLKSDGKSLYEAKLTCAQEAGDEHQHDVTCFEYIWYKDDSYAEEADAIYQTLANLTLAELTDSSSDNITNAVKKLTVRQIINDESKITGALKAIADLTVNDLIDGGIDDLYIGDLLGYTAKQDDDGNTTWYTTENGSEVQVDGIQAIIADYTIGTISTFDIETLTLAKLGIDVSGSSVLQALENTPIGEIGTEINTIKIGEMLGYTLNEKDNKWYETADDGTSSEVTGIQKLIANETLESIVDFNVNNVTLADLEIDTSDSSILQALENTPIGEIGTEIKEIPFSTILGYTEVDGKWYNGETEVTGIQKLLATYTINTIGEFDVNTVTLSDLEIDTDGNAILEALKDTKIGEMSTAINEMSIGTMMGYTKSDDIWYTDSECTTPATGIMKIIADSNITNVSDAVNLDKLTLADLDILDTDNKILNALKDVPLNDIDTEINNLKVGVALGYYRKTDTDTTWYTDEACTDENEVKGLNAKLANLTIDELGNDGMASITASLTIGDLIDSGMMSVSEDNEYKFDIVFCDDLGSIEIEETFSYNGVSVPQTVTYTCNLTCYVTYCTYHSDATAEGFYSLFEHSDNCRGSWKNMTISAFIDELLNKF